MQLSIIIVNYNTFVLTSQCIQSILDYTKDLVYEIILVDNASTECTPDKFTEVFPGLRLVKNTTNRGFAGGNNDGLVWATGNVRLLLNSDTILVDNSLKKAYDYLLAHPAIGVLSAQLLFPDGGPQSCCQRFPSLKLELLELLRLQKLLPARLRSRLLLGSFFDHQQAMEADWVWGTFFMFPSEVLHKLPGQRLPEDFFMYGEDMQWCYQIKQKLGYRIWYYPEAKVIHYLSSSASKSNMNKTDLMLRNEYRLLKMLYGTSRAWLIFKLRSIKYWTIARSYPDVKPYIGRYWYSKNYR
jgi:hypothetical protein